MKLKPHYLLGLGEATELPPLLVTAERPPPEESNVGLYVVGGTVVALLVGTGVLIYRRRRR